MRDVTIQSTDTPIRDKTPDLCIPELKCNEIHDGFYIASIAPVLDETTTNTALPSEVQSRVRSQEGKGF